MYKYPASNLGYDSLQENNVRIIPSWSTLYPLHGSCPLTRAFTCTSFSHFCVMELPKCFPKGRLEVSHSLFSSGRGSLHSMSSSKSSVLFLLERKHISSMGSFTCVGNPP